MPSPGERCHVPHHYLVVKSHIKGIQAVLAQGILLLTCSIPIPIKDHFFLSPSSSMFPWRILVMPAFAAD